MSNSWFSSWTFRTNSPGFSTGDVLELYVGDYDFDSNSAELRIGDTILTVEDVNSDIIDERVRVRITEFNETEHRGTGELLEILETEEF
jgi:hypothetical protein